jgi:hypothetical protein
MRRGQSGLVRFLFSDTDLFFFNNAFKYYSNFDSSWEEYRNFWFLTKNIDQKMNFDELLFLFLGALLYTHGWGLGWL